MKVEVTMNPEPELIESLKQDISWTRDHILNLSSRLNYKSGRAFRLSTIGEVQKIYDEGRRLGKYQDLRFPNLSFDESNRKFSVTFFMGVYPLDLTMEVELRKSWDQWRIKEVG